MKKEFPLFFFFLECFAKYYLQYSVFSVYLHCKLSRMYLFLIKTERGELF